MLLDSRDWAAYVSTTVVSLRYRSFFLTYIAFLGLTVAIALIAYVMSYVTVRNVTLAVGQQDLDYAVQHVETNITAAYDSVSYLLASPPLRTLARAPRPLVPARHIQLVRMHETLASFAMSSSFVDRVSVALFEPQVLVSSDIIVTNVPWFYLHFLRSDEWTFEEWWHLIRGDRPHVRVALGADDRTNPGRAGREVLLLQSIPIGSLRPFGTVMLHVPEDRFLAPLERRIAHPESFAVITGLERIPIAMLGNREIAETLLDSEGRRPAGIVVLHARTEGLGFGYTIGIPRSQLFGPMRLIGLTFAVILLIELATGVVLAAHLARKNIQPLRSILAIASTVGGSPAEAIDDEYELISRSLVRLVQDNSHLRRIVEAQAPLLAASFIEHLLSGKIADEETLESACRTSGITFPHAAFAVSLVTVTHKNSHRRQDEVVSDDVAIEAVIAEQWRTMVTHEVHSYRMEQRTMAFIHNVPATFAHAFPERVRRAASLLSQTLTEQSRVRVAISCSGVSFGSLTVASCYSEAKALRDYQATFGLSGLLLAEESLPTSELALFTLDNEVVLTRHVLSGNVAATIGLLDGLERQIMKTPHPSGAYATLLLHQMEATILRLAETVTFRDSPIAGDVRQLIEQAAHGASAERFANLRRYFLRLCDAVRSSRTEIDSRLFADMLAFVERRHSDSQLNLDRLADEFHLSPGHVSRYFKRHAGSGFSEYLERTRIERAVRLLADTRLPVKRIAEQVGYSTTNTFYRAFRRVKGESAGSYRRRVLLDHESFDETRDRDSAVAPPAPHQV